MTEYTTIILIIIIIIINYVALVRERTIPPLVGEVIANLC
jgi:hypothetical protein